MKEREIAIDWKGPFSLDQIIDAMDNGGQSPTWEGEDYGLYQIYGGHELYGKGTLLYVGQTTEQTFSQRFKEHKNWLEDDLNGKEVEIYLGRIYDPKKHSPEDNWESWKRDVEIAEKIIIHRYSPSYNGKSLSKEPTSEKIRLIHMGERGRLRDRDIVPKRYHER